MRLSALPYLSGQPAVGPSAGGGESKLTNDSFAGTTPSRIQMARAPRRLAMRTSVQRRSPTTTIWSARVTPEEEEDDGNDDDRKKRRISSRQPGFLVLWRSTRTPTAASSRCASACPASSSVPDEFDTISSRSPGNSLRRRWNVSCSRVPPPSSLAASVAGRRGGIGVARGG